MKTSTDPGALWLAGTLFAIMSGTILAIGAGKLPMQQDAIPQAPAVCEFATARCSPSGGWAFTDSDGLRQTVDRALWDCYWEVKQHSQRFPSTPEGGLHLLYWTCLDDFGVVI